ncbi:trypsin-like peptidase domain-containing protein [Thermotomaculum hydrothermale]|uniref:trypsin-like peptidase domain-containing protein n=1 Tax=Thermotomaculum hydrothermale TaxID=981385 RepID=UPI002ED12771
MGLWVIISKDGYIVTNNHVIDKAKKIVVTLKDGRKFDAKVIGTDPEIDIALIKIDANNLKYVPLGDSDKVKVGEWVIAIGNPLMYDHTVTAGIISAKGRRLSSGLESFLQTDAAINFGNSGGPLVNMAGEVIGVNTAISAQGQNIGFAVPINLVKEVLPDLKKYGKVERGALGVTVSKLSDTDKKAFGVDHGALVQSVQPGMAADKAGIKPYDIIIKVNGKEIKTNDDLVKIISSHKPKDKVKITVIRNGKEKEFAVTLDSRNDFNSTSQEETKDNENTSPKSIKEKLGFSIMDITPRLKYRLRLPEDVNGVVITDIDPMSEAYDKFLRNGVVITELNRKPITNAYQFANEIKKLKKGDIIILKVYQDGNFRILSLEIK